MSIVKQVMEATAVYVEQMGSVVIVVVVSFLNLMRNIMGLCVIAGHLVQLWFQVVPVSVVAVI
jgi:hypothetical protein